MVRRTLGHHKVLGIAFLALLVLGVYATYAIFTKKYTDYDEVKLETSTIGLQLPSRADVKIRGVIVGEVLDSQVTADGAELTLGLFPSQVDTIPQNVTASIVPKTLFGEKYVSLIVPTTPSSDHIEQGNTITRTVVSTEVEKVLSDLYPLLRAVQPAQVNMTLNALATALEGRGNQLGQNLETVDAYLKRLNPQIPALVEDLRLTGNVSDIYSDILPQVAQILDDTVKTAGTFESREQKVKALFNDVASLADTTRSFLVQNEESLVRLPQLGAKQLRVFSRYSTEFPCLLSGVVKAGKLQAETLRGFELHIILETLPRQPRGYGPQDKPRYGETRGPNCLHLPNPPWSQSNPVKRQPNFDDGIDETTGKGTSRVATGFDVRDGQGYAGSNVEASLYRQLLAPGLGLSPDEVGDLGPLLVGPMARGAEVTLR